MAVPKKKTSRSKRNMRRSHDAIKPDKYVENSDTGEFHRPHPGSKHDLLVSALMRFKGFAQAQQNTFSWALSW